ncbi:Imm26 family immunity protein [Aeromonas hydrophila]|uniref:Imm26 family immunity protein n=1 Tax=Aeromonas hydrophila TaxID=644 RepID=UPI0035B96ED6
MKAGDVYSIPLFLTGVSGLESFYRYDFTKEGMTFCFARAIEDRGGSGLIIEVFNTQGGIDMSLSEIINSSRLFNPVAVAGEAIKKKRWRLIGSTDYEKERDSHYSEITFLIGPRDNRSIWKGGVEIPIDDSNCHDFEEYIIWPAVQIEQRIVHKLEKSVRIKK